LRAIFTLKIQNSNDSPRFRRAQLAIVLLRSHRLKLTTSNKKKLFADSVIPRGRPYGIYLFEDQVTTSERAGFSLPNNSEEIRMQLIKSFAFVGALALVLSVCSANYLSTLSNVNIDTRSDCGQTFWDWVTGSGCSAEAPVQQYRPEDRPQVVCTSWCPGGYTRREVSIGPDCSWYHIGKCVDRSGYYGESCGFAARTCIPGVELSCQPATQEDANKNAHSEACYFEP